MKNSQIIVAYVCDEKYIPYLKISMDSVKRYNKNVRFVVLSRRVFQLSGAEVYQIIPDSDKFKYRTKDRMGEGVYYKFYLPKLPFNKVLYLDCDVICQRPLNPLWNEKCDFICATESHRFGKKQAEQLGVEKYALTGMMLMNLEALRKENFTERCLDRLSRENPHWHDETIINLEFNDRIRFIDKKYNYCRDRVYDDPIPENDAYLLHYVSNQKKDMKLRGDFTSLGRLKEELKGKTVAIVGNSQGILNSKYAEEIDGHDIVIRFNKGFPSDTVGHKTDVVFLACTLTGPEISRYGDAWRVRRSKLSQNACDFALTWADRAIFTQTRTRAVERKGLTACQASTGFLAINFALGTDCSKIDLYGFDFFQSPTYYNDPGYQTLHNGDKEGEKILEYEKYGLLTIRR